MSTNIWKESLYFRDGHRKIDFVLVHNNKADVIAMKKIKFYFKSLEEKGIEIEFENGSFNDELTFTKLHGPRTLLLECSEIFGLDLLFKLTGYKPPVKVPFTFMKNELNSPNPESPIYKRGLHIFTHPKDFTSAERANLMYRILQRNEYGIYRSQYGIERLLEKKVFLAAYPLHNGGHEWSETGNLNERQLMKRYWSNAKSWNKQQPLNVIERYLGPEYGFYFAFVGFYNGMLIPLAIIGIIWMVVGIASFQTTLNTKTQELCISEITMCPKCHVEHCEFSKLKDSCLYAYLSFFLDNPITMTLAAIAAIWTTFFTEFWRRRESILQLRWHLTQIQVDVDVRPEFEYRAKRRISKIDWKMEPYLPARVLCFHYTITIATILFLIVLVLLGIFGVMMYRKVVVLILIKSNTKLIISVHMIASITGAIISLLFIIIFEFLYRKTALWLTIMENPRTQEEFDNSFIYKTYALAFVNNYAVVFYIAFFKGAFHTYPGDEKVYSELAGMRSDQCDPSGCITDLAVQLLIIMVGRNIVSNLLQIFLPLVLIFKNRFSVTKKLKKGTLLTELPQWEDDFLLNPVDKYHIISEYTQMIIQYGFVTFFIAGFPLAPTLALINNLVELRVDALKMTKTSRRPIPKRVSNLGAWDGILEFVTYMGIATNAFVIAFTSECVPREIYRRLNDVDLEGFVNHTLSVFKVLDFKSNFAVDQNVSYCYYKGLRFSPEHPEAYGLSDEFWFELALRLLTVIVYEHVFMSLTGMIASSIPDIPFSVKKHINLERNQAKQYKIQELNTAYLGKCKVYRSTHPD